MMFGFFNLAKVVNLRKVKISSNGSTSVKDNLRWT